jgi:hypothetical protein
MASEFLSQSYFDPQGQFSERRTRRTFLDGFEGWWVDRASFRRTEPAPETSKPEGTTAKREPEAKPKSRPSAGTGRS